MPGGVQARIVTTQSSQQRQAQEDEEVDDQALARAVACNQNKPPLKFVLLENEAVNAAIEDDIRQDLERVG
eukprot:CAMPEP_0172466150 /NCGR_PEP_ID=MMETSP1065-20121228/55358_1 /TAXON_ID=265537 /ORGANISM="Amphiprora paludosa, Strain CCMP125" /LENGTH=70 /DNA_ID=CAMNT_0013222869 /DNA_START=6 /DNA_END=214 /DNA_ORIENTATION=+